MLIFRSALSVSSVTPLPMKASAPISVRFDVLPPKVLRLLKPLKAFAATLWVFSVTVTVTV